MVAEPELNCIDCRCYKCNLVECGRSLCSGKVNAAHATLYNDCFSSRCVYIDALTESNEPETDNPLPFLYVGDDDVSEEPEHDEF